jgi:hypothetical protein
MAEGGVDTYNWDTVLALRLPDVNRLLARDAATFPCYQLSHTAGGVTTTLGWSFAGWTLADVDGTDIQVTTTFGELQVDGQPFDVTGLTLTVACRLLIKPALDGHVDPAGKHPLRCADAQVQLDDQAAARPSSQSDRLSDVEDGLEAWFKGPEGLACLNAHFDGLTIRASGRGSFLTPKERRYAGAMLADDTVAFGTLAKTLKSDVTGCPLQLSPYAIPAPAKAGFLISAEVFLANMLRPALPGVFGGDPAHPERTYSVYDGNKLRNEVELRMSFATEDGKHFTGIIDPKHLVVTLTGSQLDLSIRNIAVPVNFILKGVETIYIDIAHSLGLGLIESDSAPAHKVLSFVEKAPPVVTKRTEPGLVVTLVQPALALAGTIAAIFAARVGAGWAAGKAWSWLTQRLIAVLCASLVEAATFALASIPDIIAHLDRGSLEHLPDFTTVLDQGLRDMQWARDVRFVPVSATFNDHVQIGLDIVEIPT